MSNEKNGINSSSQFGTASSSSFGTANNANPFGQATGPYSQGEMKETLIVARNIHKSYFQGAGKLEILKGLSLEVHRQEALVILGASGAGKSTFLQILGTLDQADQGEIFFEGRNLSAMTDDQRAQFRNQEMGFVFQFHHLVREITALENVLLPVRAGLQKLTPDRFKQAQERAIKLFEDLGISHRLQHYPSELSGGELQRVSIARALINSPKIIFADEPTGNLDSQNSLNVQDLFFRLQAKYQVTLIVVTHDMQFAQRFPRILKMRDGIWV